MHAICIEKYIFIKYYTESVPLRNFGLDFFMTLKFLNSLPSFLIFKNLGMKFNYRYLQNLDIKLYKTVGILIQIIVCLSKPNYFSIWKQGTQK